MHTVKWIVGLSLLASPPVMAYEKVYDYQGQVMNGFGGPETFTVQLDFLGPLSNPVSIMDINIEFSGTYSASYGDGCLVDGCPDLADPWQTKIITRDGKFIGADLTLTGDFDLVPGLGSLAEGTWIIGSTGDSLSMTALGGNGTPVISVANSTPGVWKQVRVNRVPEVNASGALPAMTLIAGFLLISTGKRRCSLLPPSIATPICERP